MLKRFCVSLKNRLWYICAWNELSSPAKQSDAFTVRNILNTLHHNKHAASRYVLSELDNERAKNRPTNTLERRSLRTECSVLENGHRCHSPIRNETNSRCSTSPLQSHIFPVTFMNPRPRHLFSHNLV